MRGLEETRDWSTMHPREKENIATQLMFQGGTTTDLEILLDEGMSPDQKLEMGAPILQIAVNKGRLDMVNLLLGRGADINLIFDHGGTGHRLLTALDAALSPDTRGPNRDKIIEFLRSCGAKTGKEMKGQS